MLGGARAAIWGVCYHTRRANAARAGTPTKYQKAARMTRVPTRHQLIWAGVSWSCSTVVASGSLMCNLRLPGERDMGNPGKQEMLAYMRHFVQSSVLVVI